MTWWRTVYLYHDKTFLQTCPLLGLNCTDGRLTPSGVTSLADLVFSYRVSFKSFKFLFDCCCGPIYLCAEFVVVGAVGGHGRSNWHEVQLSLRSLVHHYNLGDVLDLDHIPETFEPLKWDVDEIGDRSGGHRSGFSVQVTKTKTKASFQWKWLWIILILISLCLRTSHSCPSFTATRPNAFPG